MNSVLTPKWPNCCWLLVIAATMCACGPADPGVYFIDQPDPQIDALRSVDTVSLEVVADYGSDHGSLWFSKISDIAVDATATFLAVAEQDRCQITVINRHTEESWRFGGCGDGPDEFADIAKITFVGNEILAYDAGRRVIIRTDVKGTVVERIRPEVLDAYTPHLSSLAPFGDGLLVVGLHGLPAVQGGSDHRLMAVLELESGRTVRKLIDDAEIAKVTRRPFLRGIVTCVDRAAESDRVVAANIWSTQLLVLIGEALRVQVNVATSLPWRRPVAREGEPGSWRPPLPAPGLACGRDYFMVMYRDDRALPGTEPTVTVGHLEIRDYEGRVVFGADGQSPGPGSLFHYLPAAAAGEYFFAFTNGYADYPTVREYRVSPERTTSEKSGS